MTEYKQQKAIDFSAVSNTTYTDSEENRMNHDRKIVQAQEWLALIDNGQYRDSWSTAAPYFQNAITAEQWKTTLQGVRQPLGKVISREARSTECTNSLPGAPDGEYVVIQYQTSFEHKKSALETITLMSNRENTWKVGGYFIK